jgi:tryptophan-rich sensory protein
MSFLFFAAKDRNHRALLAFLLGTLAVGAIASAVTAPNIDDWYAVLAKPNFAPPTYVFAPVWTLLYVAMAFAAWRVWKRVGIKDNALTLYFAQLALNLLWCVIFFGLKRVDLALSEMIVLFAGVAATAFAFRRIDRIAGFLFVPYVAWTGFMLALSYEIWGLNR